MTREKQSPLGIGKKVLGVPMLPMAIDAMYDNVWRGNLIPYAIDADPIRQDPVYKKLERLKPRYSYDSPSGSESVASHYADKMQARQMNEETYNHISRMPLWFLKLEFAIKHERDRNLRRAIEGRMIYMFERDHKEWSDIKH